MTLPLRILSIWYFLSRAIARLSLSGSFSLSAVSYDQKRTALVTLRGVRRLPMNQKGLPSVKGSAKVRLSSSFERLKRKPDFSGSAYST